MNGERGRDPRYSPLKAAWRRVMEDLGGIAAMERDHVTRVGPARLSNYGLVHESAFVPVDVQLDAESALIAAGGEPHLLKVYADQLGFNIVPKGAAEQAGESYARHLGDIAIASGKVIEGLGTALVDGRVDEREERLIDDCSANLESQVAELRADIKRRKCDRASANITLMRKAGGGQ